MITITRDVARRFRAVARRALNISAKNHQPLTIQLTANSATITMRAATASAALEYRHAQPQDPASLAIPFQLLADCENRSDQPVTIEPDADQQIVARWEDSGIPRVVRYEVPAVAVPSPVRVAPTLRVPLEADISA